MQADQYSFFYQHRYAFFFAAIAIVSVANLLIDIMEVDAAQYAAISLDMQHSGHYLQVYLRGHDYLDKPPFLFWLSSLSISLLGNTNIGYKLPAVLIVWLGIWATYQFGKLWFDRRTGIIAALMMATTQAFHLMTNDIRTDGLLTSFVILSVYFISVYLKKDSINCLLLGGVCIGGAMLAKGPIGLIIPAMAIGGHLVLQQQWKKLFNWRWLLLIPVIMLMLSPMLYGLYQQFDLHPEKEVYGLKGPSGIKFYFWTQSFGRITGENTWQNDAPFFYFFQTMLWDFFPWVLLFIPAFVIRIRRAFQKKKKDIAVPEWISLSGFIIPFVALSFSNYKLPHYVFPLFPFAAIITADFLIRKADVIPRWFESVYVFLMHMVLLISGLVFILVFPSPNIFLIALCILFYGMYWWIRNIANDRVDRWMLPILTMMILFQLILSIHFYPNLLKYQSTSQAGQLIAKQKPDEAVWYNKYGFALDYYAGTNIPQITKDDFGSINQGTWIYTDEDGLSEIENYKVIREFNDYPVTLLRPAFLLNERRNETLKKTYLIEKQ